MGSWVFTYLPFLKGLSLEGRDDELGKMDTVDGKGTSIGSLSIGKKVPHERWRGWDGLRILRYKVLNN